MRTQVARHCHLAGEFITSPPFSPETVVMIATGWDWPTLMATPADIVDEILLYHNTVAEYRAQNDE